MSHKLRFLKRTQTTRQNVRDRVAAQTAAAEERFQRAVERWHRAIDDLASAVARAPNRLDAAGSASDLWKLDDEVAALRLLVQGAEREVARTKKSMNEAKTRLATRERDVRVTERQLGRFQTEIAQREARLEQSATDDMAALRKMA